MCVTSVKSTSGKKRKKKKRKKNPQEAQKQPQDRAQVAAVQRMPSVEKIVLLLKVTFFMESVLVDGTLRSENRFLTSHVTLVL